MSACLKGLDVVIGVETAYVTRADFERAQAQDRRLQYLGIAIGVVGTLIGVICSLMRRR